MTRDKRKNKKQNKTKFFYLVIIIIALSVIVINAYNVVTLEIYQAQVNSERQALLKQKSKLEEEIKNVSDPKYIEQQARTQLRMIFPGETLYILPEKTKEKNEDKQ